MEFSGEERKPTAPFLPRLEGCVRKDPRLARALEPALLGELYAVADDAYFGLIGGGEDPGIPELFDTIAADELRHFRLIGRLIAALGGNPSLRTSPCRGGCRNAEDSLSGIFRDAIRDKRNAIDRLETLLAKSEDRVVRSVLTAILSDEERHRAALEAAGGRFF